MMNKRSPDHSLPPPAAIAITPGEPAGIGPDLVLQIAQLPHSQPLVVFADEQLLRKRAQLLGLPLNILQYTKAVGSEPAEPGSIYLSPVPLARQPSPGQPNAANAESLLEALRQATRGCLEGRFQAMVTGPINKAMINNAGFTFTGHTEFIAELCQVELPVMLLIGGNLRVALATTHMALREVSARISQQHIEQVLTVLIDDLQRSFKIADPRILVLGLNPHAGEDGFLGTEEIDSIRPAVDKLIRQGRRIEGPVPADTAFLPARLQNIDAVLSMYHDQGLPVLKHAGFGEAVNITLGLPVIRTSVDHGTALELAGSGQAQIGSFRSALHLAQQIAANRAGAAVTTVT